MKSKRSYNGMVTKGVAYIRHHVADRLISDGLVKSRNEFTEIVWKPFQTSNVSFIIFLFGLFGDKLRNFVIKDRKQALWTACFIGKAKTSSLCVLPEKLYHQAFKLDDKVFLALLTKTVPTSNGVDWTIQIPSDFKALGLKELE
jgi:hypothetical protein